jgi:hypothetical protein
MKADRMNIGMTCEVMMNLNGTNKGMTLKDE